MLRIIQIYLLIGFFGIAIMLSSCSHNVNGYQVKGSKDKAFSHNEYSSRSGSRYKMGFGTSKQAKKSFSYNYGRKNSFGVKTKGNKGGSSSSYGSSISFGSKKGSKSSAHGSQTVYGSGISFGEKKKHGAGGNSGGSYGSSISFGRSKKSASKSSADKVYGDNISFGKKSANTNNNSAASATGEGKNYKSKKATRSRTFFLFRWFHKSKIRK